MKYYITPNNSDLLHFGILGMKWGVRRYQNKDGSLTSEGKRRYSDELIKKLHKGYDAYNGVNRKGHARLEFNNFINTDDVIRQNPGQNLLTRNFIEIRHAKDDKKRKELLIKRRDIINEYFIKPYLGENAKRIVRKTSNIDDSITYFTLGQEFASAILGSSDDSFKYDDEEMMDRIIKYKAYK